MFFFDPMWLIIVGPAILLAFYAQAKVKSTYKRYSQVAASSGLTARETARRILATLPQPVAIEAIQGKLTDHYDPRQKVLRLSQPESRSLADIGIAAHEAGHALQDAANYRPLVWRSAIVPAANFGSQLAFPLLLAGFFIPKFFGPLMLLAILGYSLAVLFSLVTLPVEFNASRRALVLLRQSGAVSSDQELAAVGQVLNAAALTYVAAAASAVLNLLYFVMIFLGGRRS
ncbi:MAG TPA: zinc metallopeptidase [Candidatus Fraserbacteria bacterium]|nr:zinc metallopeptidase [Candidatus Fraserbacteria bacterium]